MWGKLHPLISFFLFQTEALLPFGEEEQANIGALPLGAKRSNEPRDDERAANSARHWYFVYSLNGRFALVDRPFYTFLYLIYRGWVPRTSHQRRRMPMMDSTLSSVPRRPLSRPR